MCKHRCRSQGQTSTLLWKNILLWRRTPKTSAIELICPLFLCAILVFLRSQVDYQLVPSLEIPEVTYDSSGDVTYNAVFHYPLVEEERMTFRSEERWMEDTYGFAGVIPRSRLMFIPKSCFWTGNFATQRQLIGLAPRNEYTTSIANQLDKWVRLYKSSYGFQLDLKWRFFDSKEEMFEYVEHDQYMIDIENRVGLCFGVSHSEETGGDGLTEHRFELHFENQDASRYANVPNQNLAARDEFNTVPDFVSYYQYASQGFNLMQNWCANAILRGKLNNLDATIISLIKPMRSNEFAMDDFTFALKDILPRFMIVIFLLPIYRMLNLIVSDRLQKTKDMNRSMGIRESSYWLSWLLYYLLIITFLTLSLSVMLTYGVFKYSELGPVFLLMWSFGMSLFGYIVLIQAFFKKPTLAAIVGSLLFFVSSFLDQIIKDDQMAEHYKLLGSIAPSIAIQRCFICVAQFELQRQGLTWATLSAQTVNYRVAYGVIMMLTFMVTTTAVGTYMTQVLPGIAGGFREPICFCMGLRSNQTKVGGASFGQEDDSGALTTTQLSGNFEPVNRGKYHQQIATGNVLKIQNLTKIYGKGVRAVDKLNVEMYGGEIYALLGHNGAGKTTTIKMIIGLLEASGGRMLFKDKNLALNRSELHNTIGVCPQENILYDALTVMEHFRLFASLRATKTAIPDARGRQELPVEHQIDKLIEDLDLSDYRNVQARNLSGGNKRKLQVGLAFVGNACSLVLLDEPTAGLDIAARRRMWDMLQAYKEDRVIILTTHYMDEAEILGDTIGIMAQGRLVCQGSTAFLTRRYGTGSRITLQASETRGLTEMVEAYERATKQDVRVESLDDANGKLAILLPDAKTQRQLAPMLKLLEDQTERFGLRNVEISQTTLEQVFMQVASGARSDTFKANSGAKIDQVSQRESIAMESLRRQIKDELIVNRRCEFCRHAGLVIKKRVNVYRRSFKTILLEVFIPLILILTGFSMQKIIILFESEPKELTPDFFGENQKERLLVNAKVVNPPPDQLLSERDPNILSDGLITPAEENERSIWEDRSKSTSLFKLGDIQTTKFKTGPALGDQHLTAEHFIAALPQTRTAFKVKYFEFSDLAEDVGYGGRDAWKIMERKAFDYQFDDEFMDEVDMKAYGAYFLYEMNNSTKQFKVGTLVNITQTNAAAVYPQFMYESVLKLATGDPKLKFTVVNSPWPISQQLREQEQAASFVFLVFVITISYALMQASTIAFILHEKERKLKHMQLIQGMSRMAYWTINLLFDLFKCLLISGLILLLIQIYQIDFPDCWTLLLEYPFAIVPFTYASSFLFAKESTAQNWTIFMHLVIGSICSSTVFVLRLIKQTEDQADLANIIMKVFPSYALSSGMLYSAGKQLLNETREYTPAEIFNATTGSTTGVRLSKSAYDDALASLPERTNITLESYELANMGGDMAALACHFCIWMLVVVIVETGLCALLCNRSKNNRNQQHNSMKVLPGPDLHEDGVDQADEKCLIKVTNLQKTYAMPGCRCCCAKRRDSEDTNALVSTDFHVVEHECFSLLGENGAGKSTSFKILTQEVDRTGGDVQLLGVDADSHQAMIAREMGYCPQDDVLFDLLTVEEHLNFYASLRGLANRRQHVDELITTLRLDQDRHKLTQNLSGGNKRKLSVGCALVAKPRLILLDEPSTGVDPDARQHMWQTIDAFIRHRGKRSSAILLTTHSMEEAETLSSRLAIMTKGGQIACQGSTAQIKNDFGKNFNVELTFRWPENAKSLLPNSGLGAAKTSWQRSQFIRLLDENQETHLASQARTKGILWPRRWAHDDDAQLEAGELSTWYFFHSQLLSVVYSLLDRSSVKSVSILEPQTTQAQDGSQSGASDFKITIEKDISGHVPVMTKSELIVTLGKINALLTYQVEETTLEQIFQQVVAKNTDRQHQKNQASRSPSAAAVRFTRAEQLTVADVDIAIGSDEEAKVAAERATAPQSLILPPIKQHTRRQPGSSRNQQLPLASEDRLASYVMQDAYGSRDVICTVSMNGSRGGGKRLTSTQE